ncbi:unnamed protein product [Ascophyllum nodosum]
MGRWTALVMVSSLSGSEAFLLPCGVSSEGVRSSTKLSTWRRSFITQPVARCPVCSVQRCSTTRKLNTRIGAGAKEEFKTAKEYDVFLAELVFSQSDVRDDVLKNLDKAADEGFIKWLEQKIEDCQDIDERVGLKSLLEIIVQVKTYVDKAIKEQEEEAEKAATEVATAADAEVVAESGSRRTNDQVWEEMRRLQRLGAEAGGAQGTAAESLKQAQISPFEGLPDKVRSGYEELLNKILDRSSLQTLEEAVDANYDQCDVQFLTLLSQKAQEAADTERGEELAQLRGAINEAMQRKMAKASERLQASLGANNRGAGDPSKMQKSITAMAGRGEVDDALVLLLQANLEQAENAGAKPAAEVLKMLGKAAQVALDEKAEPEKRLLRQLLRAEGKEERLQILGQAFRQRAKVVLADGSETSEAPEVTPPKFIEVVKGVIRNFGNVGEAETGFADKLDDIISEAEQVATDLYGESMSPQDRQDRIWKDATVSVFDLENLEQEGKLRGEEMPWANDQYDMMSPEMMKNFKKDEDGNIIIGGG